MEVNNDFDLEPLICSETKKERSAEIIQQINSKNAKLIACALVLSFILYHGTVHLRYGSDSCKWLLSEGRYKGDMEWQPYGCMMHRYSQTDTRRCLRYLAFWDTHNYFVFIGDTKIHDLYNSFIDHLSGNEPVVPAAEPSSSFTPLSNQTFVDPQLKLTVKYIWSPDVGETMVSYFYKWKNANTPPVVVVAGCGTWVLHNTNKSAEAVHDYATNITRLVESIDRLGARHSWVLWVLQEPVDESKLPPLLSNIKNQHIDQLNKAAIDVLHHSRAKIWASSRLMVEDDMDNLVSGLYLGASCRQHDTQLLLNAYCNDHMNFNDGTCCSSAELHTPLQALTFAFFGICCIIGFVAALRRYQLRRNKDPPSPAYTLVTSLAKLGVILAYFYLCDRTNFFMKENKYYSPVSFWLPIGYVFALGLFFTEDSRYTKVLHREQTDEWKGWMQLVLLIYHVTGASSNLQIYNHVQILVSAYLFLTGYGHFCYLWHRTDGGIVRFFQVMFRLNLLAVCLCLFMNRPYQFYTFTPLVSFWVMLVYMVLTAPPRVSAGSVDSNPLHYLYLVLKMVTLFSLIIMLYMSEVFFEKVFVTRPWKALFVTTDDDIHEWWNRWKLDRYSMSYGVVFGMGLLVAQKFNLVDDNNHSNLFSPRPAIFAVFLALIGITFSSSFALLCHNKSECNEVHSYTVFVPIISFAVLRNISGMLRTRYSSFFAWFGRISLELFICQHHIWLAADTHGVLVLLPGYPVLNVLITLFIFVCASHELHNVTLSLLPYAVPSDWRLVLRNVFIFFIILVPIGIHDGMF